MKEENEQTLRTYAAADPELLAFAKWARDTLVGDSGAGYSHWAQFPEFLAGLNAIAKAEGEA